jgi:hypothetical protein
MEQRGEENVGFCSKENAAGIDKLRIEMVQSFFS